MNKTLDNVLSILEVCVEDCSKTPGISGGPELQPGHRMFIVSVPKYIDEKSSAIYNYYGTDTNAAVFFPRGSKEIRSYKKYIKEIYKRSASDKRIREIHQRSASGEDGRACARLCSGANERGKKPCRKQ